MSRDTDIVDIYTAGIDAETLGSMYGISSRQIQRIVNAAGAARTQSESYNLAIQQGRMVYLRKPKELLKKRKTINPKLRYQVFARDDYTCQVCGATKDDCLRLEVDHINADATDNRLDNLQVLCNTCNIGKAWATNTMT
jgi:hypothetical protein